MIRAAAAAVAVMAAVAAGCGGGGSSATGAGLAPKDAPAFVSLKTDQALKLAARFPALSRLEQYRDAVGPELDVVWLDLGNGGDDVVLLTKPRKLARLKTLLQPNGTEYSRIENGWVVIANQRRLVDRYKRAVHGGKLAGQGMFKAGFSKLDRGAAVRSWVRGSSLQSALDAALVRQGAAPRITHDAGELRSIAAAARVEAGGVSFDAYGLIDPKPHTSSYAPALQDTVPAGALLYVSSAGLDRPTRSILRMVADSKPNFERQLEQVQAVLNISLERDVYPMLKGESALAIYAGRPVPPVLFLQKVADETKADGLVRRFGAVAQLSGSARVESVQVAGTTAQKLTFKGSRVSVYAGVARGHLFVADTASLAREAVGGPARALAADPLFRQARHAAGVPAHVSGFAYGDLRSGIPFLLDLAHRGGSTISPAAVANTKPLQHAFAYLVPDGDGLRLSGFTGFK